MFSHKMRRGHEFLFEYYFAIPQSQHNHVLAIFSFYLLKESFKWPFDYLAVLPYCETELPDSAFFDWKVQL